MTIFSETWNLTFEGLPPDNEFLAQGAGRIRDLKRDIREREIVDHSWAGDALDGYHNFAHLLTQSSDPALLAGSGILYTKVISTHNELFYENEAGTVMQITSGGLVLGATTGDVKLTFKNTADSGWVLMNDGTLGNAASGGTARANADTVSLFTLLWNNIINTWCPVSGGRGASAAADYAANKTITLPKSLGRALAVSGTGSGLTARVLGENLGEETHLLTGAESGTGVHTHGVSDSGHTHSYNLTINTPGGGLSQGAFGGTTPQTTGVGSGGVTVNNASAANASSAHNTMQPSAFWNVMVKL